MTLGWAAFLGAALGSTITGLSLLIADLFKHRRLRQERVQGMLISERIKAYDELTYRLTQLWWDLPLTQTGLEPLRWPKDRQVSPNFFNNAKSEEVKREKDLAEKTDQRLEELKEFIHAHTIILAPKVQYVFWEAFAEFSAWRTKLSTQRNGDLDELCPNYFTKVQEALNGLRDRTNEAIAQDLAVQGFNVPTSDQLDASRRRGRERVERYFIPNDKKKRRS